MAESMNGRADNCGMAGSMTVDLWLGYRSAHTMPSVTVAYVCEAFDSATVAYLRPVTELLQRSVLAIQSRKRLDHISSHSGDNGKCDLPPPRTIC